MTNTSVVNADIPLDPTPSLPQRLAAEVFGTFVLVTGVIGTALFFAPQFGALPVAIAVGLTIIGGAYAVGHISGGHFNPAVTLSAAVAGRFAWRDVLPYMLAQLVGGLVAGSVLAAIRAGIPSGEKVNTFTAVSNGWGSLSGLHASMAAVALTEALLTAVFTMLILGVTDRRAPSGFAPLAIGASLTLIHLIAIPISNASVNPARSLATAVWGGPDALGQLWLFFIAPLIGGAVAGLVYRAVFERTSRRAVPVTVADRAVR
ncbi:MAG: aquaporin [Microbacteriaceae bacterium]|nr:aquaporin [Microbacteriaceae bacterium]